MKCEDIKVGTLVCHAGAIYPHNQLYEITGFEPYKKGSKKDPYYSYQPDFSMKAKGLDNGEEMSYACHKGSDFWDVICKDNDDRRKAILRDRLPMLQDDLEEILDKHFGLAKLLGANEEENKWFLKMFKDFATEIINDKMKEV